MNETKICECSVTSKKKKLTKGERRARREAKAKRQSEQAKAKKKNQINKTKEQERMDALTHYDLTSYDDDIEVMASIFNIRRSKT